MFKELITSFEEVQSSPKKSSQTVFDICGFPHYENVISNVLAFYFDDSNNHDLNGLLAESLIEASGISGVGSDMQFQVEREVKTESGGFIDLLLTNDSCCIVLENKIYASLYNDLSDYINYGKKQGCEKTIGIVLSRQQLDLKHSEYVNVVYPELTSKIRSKLGNFVSRDSNQYLFLLIDFINNIESLCESGTTMNPEFVTFIRQNIADVQRFGKELKRYHDDLRRVVKQVNTLVTDSIGGISVTQSPWRNLPDLYDIAVTNLTLKNGMEFQIDSKVNPEKWEYTIFIRKDTGVDFSLKDYCTSKGLAGSMKENRFVLNKTLPSETNPTEVAETIAHLIKSLNV